MSKHAKILERMQWRKVKAPVTWRPTHVLDELIGFYGGKTVRNGKFGQYEVVMIHVPKIGSFMVSGVKIVQLVDGSCISKGEPVRIVYNGEVELGEEYVGGEARRKYMKDFEVFVADGPAVSLDEIPTYDQRSVNQ